MDRIAYRNFTERLNCILQQHDQVIGLVAVGSMAERNYLPDEWSDHDFYIITHPGQQNYYRSNYDWLPDPGEIAWVFPETEHGVKVIYRDGHLVEYAVFDLQELNVAKANRFRVLIDKGGVQQAMAAVASATIEWSTKSTDQYLAGQFLTNLLVGIGRYRRGERMSAHKFIKGSAPGYLVTLFSRHVCSADPNLVDNIDSTRRFERTHPELGRELERLMLVTLPESARGQLALFQQFLGAERMSIPVGVIEIIRQAVSVGDD